METKEISTKWHWVTIKDVNFELRYFYDVDTSTEGVDVYEDDLLGNFKHIGEIWGLEWFTDPSENGEYDEFIYQVENWLDNNYF